MTNWKKLGAWEGGAVLALAAHGEVTLAATLAGVFRSADGGRTWALASSGFGEQSITCVATSPGGELSLAANGAGGLFESRDLGASWSPVKTWSAEFGRINTIAFSPAFASDGALFVGTTLGPYRSFDGARSWQFADFGLLDLDVTCLAISPEFADDETLWAGGASGGVARSRNGARAWRECGMGLPDSPATALLATGGWLLAGFEDGGVYASQNLGETWAQVGLADKTISALVANGSEVLAATDMGVYATTDAGANWRRLNRGDLGALSVTVAGDVLVGSTDEGVIRLARSGASERTRGIVARVPPAVFAMPDGSMVAQAAMGIMASSEDGASWIPVKTPFDGELQAIGASETGELLAAADGALHLRSAAGRWKAWPFELPDSDAPISIATHSGMWWLATALGAVFVAGKTGATWSRLALPEGVGAMRQLLATSDGALHIVAETESRNGDLNLQIWRAEPASGDVPAAEDWVLLTTLRNPRTSWVSLLAADDALLIGAHNSVIAVTRKDGGALQGKPAVLEDEATVTALARTKQHGLLAASTHGLYQSRDGIKWKRLPGAMAGRTVVSLHETAGSVRVITLGGEVWQLAN